MKKILLGAIPFVMVFALFLFSQFVFDDSDVKDNSATSTSTTIPGSKHVQDNGPYSDELEEIAADIKLDAYDDNWHFAIVTEESGDTITTKIGQGLVAITSAGCYDSPKDYLGKAVGVGDAIVWHREGDDLTVCPGEIFIVRTAGELRGQKREASRR